MTTAEAKVAVRFNSIVEEKYHKVRGYAFSVTWVNEPEKKPYIRLGVRDLGANSVIEAAPEAFEVVDWKAVPQVVEYFIEQEKKKD